VFWKATSLRILQLREGRDATVRGGWRRVDLEKADLPSAESEPEEAVIRRSEQALLLEFAATLTEAERRVLVRQYGGTKRKTGRVTLARQLGMAIGEVRKHERNIARKLERFSAILSAGTLCATREPQLAALGTGVLNADTERIAQLHLLHCPACRADHAARLRALHRGDLQREIAQLLPGPAIVESSRRPRFTDLLPDWFSRPAAHEAVCSGSQVGLAGRGIGTIAAAKLAALCIGGISVVGGSLYCLSYPHGLGHPDPKPTPIPRIREAKQKAEPPDVDKGKIVAAQARSTPTPTSTPKPRPKPKKQRPRTSSTTPTSHERVSAISPAPAGSARDGGSEFELTGTKAANAPAPPVRSGGPEFP
jgi:hypothetical protein